METEKRATKIDGDTGKGRAGSSVSRSVSGVVLEYGKDYPVGSYFERWTPGAFGDFSAADFLANVQHDRGRPVARLNRSLWVTDSAEKMELRMELDPELAEAAEAIKMLDAGLLSGLSVEFFATDETFAGKVREIRQAKMVGVALVDTPQYATSTAHLRWRKPRGAPERRMLWLRASL